MTRISMRAFRLGITVILLAAVACTKAASNKSPLDGAPAMDLSRVPGQWHIAARYPTILDRDGVHGLVKIISTDFQNMDMEWSFQKSPETDDRRVLSVKALAGHSKHTTLWSISPFWLLKFQVQVVEFSGDYSWMVIASPDRKLMWILTKKDHEDPLLIKGLIQRLEQKGFDGAAIVVEEPKI